MSGNNVRQIIAANPLITGGFYSAPLGTTLPTDSTTPLPGPYIPLGYIGDNGITQTSQRQITDVNAWGGDLVATLQDRFDVTLKMDFLQALDVDVKRAVFHTDNVTVTPATTTTGTELQVLHNSKLLETRVWVVDSYYDLATMRLGIPVGRIVEVGDIHYTHKELTAYNATLKAFPDTAGNCVYEFDNDGVVSAT
jgi:hypothetical protein